MTLSRHSRDGRSVEELQAALGILGYEILTGQGPFAASSNAQWIRAHLDQNPRSIRDRHPEVDPDLADLLLRCLNKDPRHRPRAADVVRILGGGTPSALDPRELFRRRIPWIVGLTGALGWGLLQIVDQLGQNHMVSPIAYALSLPLVACGILASAVIGWFHGEKGRQRAPAMEWLLRAITGVVWILWTLWTWTVFRG